MPNRSQPKTPYYEIPYVRFACPIGMTWDLPFTYQPPTNGAKREWLNDEDGWQTVTKHSKPKKCKVPGHYH
jgi:hypothetical protein